MADREFDGFMYINVYYNMGSMMPYIKNAVKILFDFPFVNVNVKLKEKLWKIIKRKE